MPKFSSGLIRLNLQDLLRSMTFKNGEWKYDKDALAILEGATNHSQVQKEADIALMYFGLMHVYMRVVDVVVDPQVQGLLKAALKGNSAEREMLSTRAERSGEVQAKLANDYVTALDAWNRR